MTWAKPGPGRPPGSPDKIQRMTVQARTELVWYLRTGETYCPATNTHIPDTWKKRIDELVAASVRGDTKATRDIIDRVAGRPTQSLDVTVSDRKMIVDSRNALPEGSPIHHISGQDVKVRDVIPEKQEEDKT